MCIRLLNSRARARNVSVVLGVRSSSRCSSSSSVRSRKVATPPDLPAVTADRHPAQGEDLGVQRQDLVGGRLRPVEDLQQPAGVIHLVSAWPAEASGMPSRWAA